MSAAAVQHQIVEWLNELFEGVEVGDDDVFVPCGSTALFVTVEDFFDAQHVRVQIDAPILMKVPVSADVLQYIGHRSNDFAFGHLALVNDDHDTSTGMLVFRQTLLGDALDQIELHAAASLVAVTADSLDEDLQSRFGGEIFAPV